MYGNVSVHTGHLSAHTTVQCVHAMHRSLCTHTRSICTHHRSVCTHDRLSSAPRSKLGSQRNRCRNVRLPTTATRRLVLSRCGSRSCMSCMPSRSHPIRAAMQPGGMPHQRLDQAIDGTAAFRRCCCHRRRQMARQQGVDLFALHDRRLWPAMPTERQARGNRILMSLDDYVGYEV